MCVLIKNMQISKTCLECIKSGLRTAIHCEAWSEISAGLREHTRSLSCPLEEVPRCKDCFVDGFCEKSVNDKRRFGYCNWETPKVTE